jgi:hypothetical protein
MTIHTVVLLERASRIPVSGYTTTRLYGVMTHKAHSMVFIDFKTSEFKIMVVLHSSIFIKGKSGAFTISSKNLC